MRVKAELKREAGHRREAGLRKEAGLRREAGLGLLQCVFIRRKSLKLPAPNSGSLLLR